MHCKCYRLDKREKILEKVEKSFLTMFAPGSGFMNLTGTNPGAGLCLPQYMAFNPLQQQYR